VAASASDNVNVVGVQFFLDGVPMGSEVPDSPYSISWDTTTTAPGSHTLTARARDAAGNSTVSASVPVTVQSTSVGGVGQWSSVSSWPLVAVHAILLPTGNILAFDGAAQNGAAYIWNPTTNTFTSRNAADNIFCAGHCLLPDGRVLVVGGHIANFVGIPDANIFNPSASSWTQIPSMSYGRWYPTAITLPDGRVLVVAGDDGCAGCWVANPEIYNPATNSWLQLSNASNPLPEYPHLFVLSDGRVLVTGTFEQPIATQVLDVNAQTWTMVDPVVVDGHSSVMYAPDKFMKSGTSATSDPPYWPAETTTYVLDMTQPQPSWRETAPMAYPRSYHNLTILPDGNVLVTGGNVTTNPYDQTEPVYPVEMWSPETETWTTMASMSVPRFYHSTAVLLPDGRVVVAGGGRFGGGVADDKLNAQIYSPPYLFKGTRPAISSAPNLISYNSNFTVNTTSAPTIAKVVLIPLGSVTHHFNANQRYVSLPFQGAASSLSVQAPANANLAQPGYYMLFIVDNNGVPSVASIIRLQ
jgi:WD40 repeat protein